MNTITAYEMNKKHRRKVTKVRGFNLYKILYMCYLVKVL